MKGLIYLLFLIFAPDIFAGPFDPPPTDYSVSLLGKIFGSNVGSISLVGGLPNPVLSEMMEKFNVIVVVCGTIVISYIGILSTINTAQEGEAMGSKWSAAWTPLRSVAGMLMMIPSPASGYSVVQITVMWIILQGIGAADAVWNIALNGLLSGSSAMLGSSVANESTIGILGTPPPPSTTSVAAPSDAWVEQMLNVAICMQQFAALSTAPSHTNVVDTISKMGSTVQYYATDPGNPVVTPQNSQTPNSVMLSGAANFGTTNPAYTSPPSAAPSYAAVCGAVNVEGTASAADYQNSPAGTATLQQMTNDATNIYDTKQLAISTVLTILQPLAQSIVTYTTAVTTAANAIPPQPQPKFTAPAAGYRSAAREAYIGVMSGLVVPGGGDNNNSGIPQAVASGEANGWIAAGSYYFVFTQILNSTIFSDASNNTLSQVTAPGQPAILTCDSSGGAAPYITCNPVNTATQQPAITTPTASFVAGDSQITTLKTFGVTLPAEQNAFALSLVLGSNYLANDTAGVATNLNFSNNLGSGSAANSMVAPIESVATVAGTLGSVLTPAPGTDALLAHVQFGHGIMATVETAWFLMGAAAVFSFMATLPIGFGFASAPVAMLIALIAVVGSVLVPLMAILYTLGAGLAIYAPLIPYMIFTTGAIGWLLLVIEAVVAAPLIAMTLVLPSGDELGKLEHSLNLLADIFLRPMLMIFGFLLAGRVFNAAVNLISFGMLDVFQTINVITMFSFVVILFAYVGFICAVTNICFSLIYALPDKLLRWIGGASSHAGEGASKLNEGAMSAVKGAVDAGAHELGGGMQKTAGMAQEATAKNMATMAGQADAKGNKRMGSFLGMASQAVGVSNMSQRDKDDPNKDVDLDGIRAEGKEAGQKQIAKDAMHPSASVKDKAQAKLTGKPAAVPAAKSADETAGILKANGANAQEIANALASPDGGNVKDASVVAAAVSNSGVAMAAGKAGKPAGFFGRQVEKVLHKTTRFKDVSLGTPAIPAETMTDVLRGAGFNERDISRAIQTQRILT